MGLLSSKITILAMVAAACLSGQKINYYRGLAGGPVYPNSYTFTIPASSVNGSLATAGAKTVTIALAPLGVSGTNSLHRIYISGGTGTAETVTITGGSCIGGAYNCTLEFTTANTHTGSYSITSATAGIKEAFEHWKQQNPAGTAFYLTIPEGVHETYGCAYFNVPGVYISGAGKWDSRLNVNNRTECSISATNPVSSGNFNLSGLGIVPIGGVMTSGVASVYVQDYQNGGIQDFLSISPGRGIDWYNTANGGNPLVLDDIWISGAINHCLRLRSATTGQQAGTINTLYCDGTGSAAVELSGTTAGFSISNLWVQSVAYGLFLDGTTRNVNEITITNSILDGCTIACLYVEGQSISAGTNAIRLSGSLVQHGGSSYGVVAQEIAKIIVNDVTFNNLSSNPSVAFNIVGKSKVSDCRFNASSGFTAGSLVSIFGASSGIVIDGNTFTGEATAAVGINISNEANSDIFVSDNKTTSNITAALSNASTTGPVKISGNLFYETSLPEVASSTTIASPSINIGAMFSLTGTTTVTRMTGGYEGATYLAVTPSSLSLNSGGANPGDFSANTTTAAGGVYIVAYNKTDGKWYVK